MLIVCPTCASRYSIDASKIGEAGRTVRCAGCRNDFFVTLADDRSQDAAPASASDAAQARIADRAMEDETGLAPPRDLDAGLERQTTPTGGQTDQAGIDQADLDALFAEQFRDAEAQIAEIEAAEALPATPPAKGWRRFVPFLGSRGEGRAKGRKAAAGASRPSSKRKPATKTAAKSSARGGGRGGSRSLTQAALPKAAILSAAAGVLLIVAGLVLREQVVRMVPASAGLFRMVGLPVNLDGLVFADVRSVIRTEGEARFLVVEGDVVSIARAERPVPLIEIAIRGSDGGTLYTWTTEPPRMRLGPGQALQFRARLATPPEAGRNVHVRFAEAREMPRPR
jgi:predicted Zn finger-like uncharacterized protein